MDHTDAAAVADDSEAQPRQRRAPVGSDRSARRRPVVSRLLLGAVLIASTIAVIAIVQRSQARHDAVTAERRERIATARELAAASLATVDEDPELSILLALEAVNATAAHDGLVLAEAEDALHKALQRTRVELSVPAAAAIDRAGAVDLSPRGDRVATTDEATVIVSAVSGEADAITIGSHRAPVSAVAFAPDGETIATAGLDEVLVVWDVASGEDLVVIDDIGTEARSVVWFADGRTLATAAANRTTLWDVELGLARLILPGAEQVAVSEDGSVIALAQSNQAALFDAVSGERLVTIPADASDVALASDGSVVVVVGPAGQATVWDVSGVQLTTLVGHRGPGLEGRVRSLRRARGHGG